MSLHFKKYSDSGTPLVLIHGLFGSLENLGLLSKHLSKSFCVYALDLPNHGRSEHSDDMSLASMSKQISFWMDQQGLDCAHFLGHSLGGKVCMELALTNPQKVQSLVVIDIAPVKYASRHKDVFSGLLSITPSTLASRGVADKALEVHIPEASIRSFLLKNLYRNEVGQFSWRMNLSVIHRCYNKLVDKNILANPFDGNTLFLKGEHSDYIQEHYRDEILGRFPKTSLKVISNTGHWLHAEKPDIVAKIVEKFLLGGQTR